MIGVSTCWRSGRGENGQALLKEILSLGVESVELEYRITPKTFLEMRPLLEKRLVRISSLHNFLPAPYVSLGHRGRSEVFSFTSEDPEEREQALKYTLRTVQIAHILEAKVVILHLGSVPAGSKKTQRNLEFLYDKGEIDSLYGKELIRSLKETRRKKRQRSLDLVFLALERLNREAEKYNVYLGIENRYHFYEIPDFEEVGLILKKFRGGSLGYWHDVGHATVQTNLGFTQQRNLLQAYSSDLIGIHLHDVIDGYHDHEVPGSGEADYNTIMSFLTSKVIKVVEVHPQVSRKKLLESLRFLRNFGIDN